MGAMRSRHHPRAEAAFLPCHFFQFGDVLIPTEHDAMECPMRRLVGSVCFGVFALCAAFGQAPTLPAFDVATIKPNRTGKGGANLAAPYGAIRLGFGFLRWLL